MSISCSIIKAGDYGFSTIVVGGGLNCSFLAALTRVPIYEHFSFHVRSMYTQRATPFGNHPCDHYQVNGNIRSNVSSSLVASGALPFSTSKTGYYSYNVIDTTSHPRAYSSGQFAYPLILPGLSGICHFNQVRSGRVLAHYAELLELLPIADPKGTDQAHVLVKSLFGSNGSYSLTYWLVIINQSGLPSVVRQETATSGNPIAIWAPASGDYSYLTSVTEHPSWSSFVQWMNYYLANSAVIRGQSSNLVCPSSVSIRVMDQIDKTTIQKAIFEQINITRATNGRPTRFDWGDLCQAAVNTCQFVDINTAVWLKEVLTFKKSVQDTISLATGKVTPKKLAKLFLSAQYGAQLTVSDTIELASVAYKQFSSLPDTKPYLTARSMIQIPLERGHRQVNYKIYYQNPDSKILSAIKTGLDWDILPTLQNGWDMIPFSFVVDWFVDVEGFCNSVDQMIYAQYLDVNEVVYTYKDIISMQVPLKLDGALTLVDYHRHVNRKLHKIYPDFDRSDRYKDNIAELTAIIVTKK